MTNTTPAVDLTGKVIDTDSKKPVAALRVEAWSRDPEFSRVIDKDVTDTEGQLHFDFTNDVAKSFLKDSKLKLFWKVFLEDRLLLESVEKTHADWRAKEFTLEVSLKAATEPPDVGLAVQGDVRGPDGMLLAKAPVRAVDKDLRSEELLGETATDDKGHYRIEYRRSQFKRVEKASADLIVRVLSADKKTVRAESDVLFNAPDV